MLSRLGALRVADRRQWELEIRVAMARNEGRVPDAAQELGVSLRQLFRWLEEECFADVPRAPASVHRSERKR